jgi:hypothetical protein
MIMDGKPPLPEAGAVLARVGIRVYGVPSGAEPGSLDSVVVVHGTDKIDPQPTEYRLTGVASEARDVDAGPGGMTHTLAEFVLAVDDDRYQVQFEGRARAVVPGASVTVTGKLALVGDYEWDAFQLTDTRDDWLVQAVLARGTGDAMLDLVHPAKG